MNKKRLLKTIPVIALSTLAAQENQASFYVGGQVGGHHGQAKTSNDYKNYTASTTPDRATLSANGITGGIFAGFEEKFENNYVIGLEANASLANAKTKQVVSTAPTQTDTVNHKLKSSVDFLAKIGYQFPAVLGYLKVGPTFGRWNLTSKIRPVGATPADYSKTKNLTAFTAAIGVEGELKSNLHWGVEYKHSFYKSKTYMRPVENPGFIRYKNKPYSANLLFRLIYKFK